MIEANRGLNQPYSVDYPLDPINHLHAYWRMEYVENPHKKRSGARTFTELLEADNDSENQGGENQADDAWVDRDTSQILSVVYDRLCDGVCLNHAACNGR